MAMPTCIVDTCEKANQAYNEAASSPDASELQRMLGNSNSGLVKQWVIKARCYQNANEFFTAMMYYGMSIWHVCFTESDAEKKAEISKNLKDEMQRCRTALEKQWTEQQISAGGGDEPVRQFEAEDPKTLVDKVTKEPLNFTSLSGGDRAKEILQSKFIYPNIYPDLYFSEVNNVLLYGPPGTGKTLLARACAGEIQRIGGGGLMVHFFALSGSEVRSKWEGGTERNINGLFKQANELAVKTMEGERGKKAKSVIFIDEVESLASKRGGDTSDRALTTLLQEMDGFKSHPNVIILAATNRPWDLDSAFLRRFSASVLVDLEDFEGRVSLIANQVFDRFQKKDMEHEKKRYFNLESRLCSLTVSESPTSRCDTTWNVYRNMYMSNNTTIEYFFSGLDNLTDRQADHFLRFLGDHKPKNILDNDDFKDLSLPLNLYIKEKVKEYKEKVKNNLRSSGICNKDCNAIDSQNGFELAMIVFHYIAAMTGPSNEAVESDWVRDRMSADIAKSSWGYSNSDLTRLMKEVFSNTASRILQMRFTTDSKCNDENNCNGYKCFKEIEGGGNAYVEARATIKDDNFILQKNDGKGDVYSGLTITDFCNALENRDLATTTGNSNEYCTFVLYSQGGPTTKQKQHMENNTCKINNNESE
jgi:DNA polymerase III delta prime subunit